MEEQLGICVMQEVDCIRNFFLQRANGKCIMFRTQFSLWEMDDVMRNVKRREKIMWHWI